MKIPFFFGLYFNGLEWLFGFLILFPDFSSGLHDNVVYYCNLVAVSIGEKKFYFIVPYRTFVLILYMFLEDFL